MSHSGQPAKSNDGERKRVRKPGKEGATDARFIRASCWGIRPGQRNERERKVKEENHQKIRSIHLEALIAEEKDSLIRSEGGKEGGGGEGPPACIGRHPKDSTGNIIRRLLGLLTLWGDREQTEKVKR